jgi:hypothetical protein
VPSAAAPASAADGSAIEVPELPPPPSVAGSEPAAGSAADRLRDLVEPVERVEDLEEVDDVEEPDLRAAPEPARRDLWVVWAVWALADCVSEAPSAPSSVPEEPSPSA